MAGRNANSSKTSLLQRPGLRSLGPIWQGIRRLAFGLAALAAFGVLVYAVVPVPVTPYMVAERVRLGELDYDWTPMSQIAPAMQLAAVAAEDANFCLHWGFDMAEIRRVVASGQQGGASTISQQVVKNVYLWQGRSWLRKALEAGMTPLVEAVWTKRRILEVYLNVAEFGPGVFGIHAAAAYHFGTTPDRLSGTQSARLAAILPAPKTREALASSRRSRAIADGAATIAKDGRDACFR